MHYHIDAWIWTTRKLLELTPDSDTLKTFLRHRLDQKAKGTTMFSVTLAEGVRPPLDMVNLLEQWTREHEENREWKQTTKEPQVQEENDSGQGSRSHDSESPGTLSDQSYQVGRSPNVGYNQERPVSYTPEYQQQPQGQVDPPLYDPSWKNVGKLRSYLR